MGALPLSYSAIKPDGGFEPPTFALQVRCSTTKLIRHNGDGGLRSRYLPHAKRTIYQLIYIPKKNDTDEIRTRDPIGKWISSPSP